jgi:hypothetical protein
MMRMIVIPPGGAKLIGQFIPFRPLGRKIAVRKKHVSKVYK